MLITNYDINLFTKMHQYDHILLQILTELLLHRAYSYSVQTVTTILSLLHKKNHPGNISLDFRTFHMALSNWFKIFQSTNNHRASVIFYHYRYMPIGFLPDINQHRHTFKQNRLNLDALKYDPLITRLITKNIHISVKNH